MLSVMWMRRRGQIVLHGKRQQKSGNFKLCAIRWKILVLIMQLDAKYAVLVAVLHFDVCMRYLQVRYMLL